MTDSHPGSPQNSPPSSPRNNQNNNQNQNQNNNNNNNEQTQGNVRVTINRFENGTTGQMTFGNAVVVNPNDLQPITGNLTLNQTIVGNGYIVNNRQGDGVTQTTFNTTDPTFDPQITENLKETVEAYYNDELNHTETSNIMADIRDYASKIQCDDFHGKGTIDDYSELFKAAAKIANESKQIKLDVDVQGFNEFSQAADELANLFQSFIIKLENVSIINDLDFLRAIREALQKIWNLSEVFGKFKQTILATTKVQIPKSAHDTSILLGNVMLEVNCAIKYINHFVAPDAQNVPLGANLSADEQNVIQQAVATIDNWNVLCDQGVSVAMSNNTDIQKIAQVNNNLKSRTSALRNATNQLKNKLAAFNIYK